MYTDDIAEQTAGVLTAWPVQSTNAHAKVTIDVSGAYEVPGVVRVLTAEDVPGLNDAGIRNDEPLFPSEAMFYGHALVWVLGETQEAAPRRRARHRRVRAAALAHHGAGRARRAIVPGHPAHGAARRRRRRTRGLGARLRRRDRVRRSGALLPRDARVVRDPRLGGQYFIQCSTQHPTETQDLVSHVLGIPANEVTVQCLRMGGGFGGKEMQPHGFAAIAALGAKLTGRPVRLR
jgi:xanthine dehydrogenase large subunit